MDRNVTAKKDPNRVPHNQRNIGKRWSRKDRAKLARVWGEWSERKLRSYFGRRSSAILLFGQMKLKLGTYDQGVRSLKNVSQTCLGVSDHTLLRLVRECGVHVSNAATFASNVRGGPRRRKVDPDVVGCLLRQRDTRTSTPVRWSMDHGKHPKHVKREMLRRGVYVHNKHRRLVECPRGLLGEVLAGTEGPWCAVWRAVLAEGELPVARWFVALAAYDIAFLAPDDPAREWIDVCCNQKVMILVRRLAAKVRPPVLASVARTKSTDGRKKSSRAA